MNERQIYQLALAKKNAAERSAFLAEACGHDPELRRHIEGLLDGQQAGNFLEEPVTDRPATVDQPRAEVADTPPKVHDYPARSDLPPPGPVSTTAATGLPVPSKPADPPDPAPTAVLLPPDSSPSVVLLSPVPVEPAATSSSAREAERALAEPPAMVPEPTAAATLPPAVKAAPPVVLERAPPTILKSAPAAVPSAVPKQPPAPPADQPPLDAPKTSLKTAPQESHPVDFLASTDKPDRLGMLGTYEILEVVGQGSMGIVFRALDPRSNRVVAIKALAPALAAQPTAVQRFAREARATAAVLHPNVIGIHRVEDKHRPPYLVIEFVDGQSLQQTIDSEGALEVKKILRLGLQIADGLAAAHAQGLIHRDVEPANILVEHGVERVKITDFGLARAADDVSLGKDGPLLGAPSYVSPEQAAGQPGDARSDLFSLGCVLYALAAGRPPFQGASPEETLRHVCDKSPKAIQDVNPDVPDWLAAIINRLMAKDRVARFQTAAEVAQLLASHLARLQQPPTGAAPARFGQTHTALPGQAGQLIKPNWGLAIVIGLIGAGLVIVSLVSVAIAVIVLNQPLTLHNAGGKEDKKKNAAEKKKNVIQLEFGERQVLGPAEQKELWEQVRKLPRREPTPGLPLPPEFAGLLKFDRGRIAPTGRYLAATGAIPNVVRAWSIIDLTTHKEVRRLDSSILTDPAFAADGKTIAFVETESKAPPAVVTDKEEFVAFLQIDTGVKRRVDQPLSKLFKASHGKALAFSGDGKLVAVGGGYAEGPTPVKGRVILIDVGLAKLSKPPIDLPCSALDSLAFSPDGNKLLVVVRDRQALPGGGVDKTAALGALLIDVPSGKPLPLTPPATEPERWSGAVVFPSATRAAAVRSQRGIGYATLFVWDAKTGQTLTHIPGIGTAPSECGLAIAPKGNRLVVPLNISGIHEAAGLVVNLESLQPETLLWRGNAGGGFPRALGFAEDGRTIMTVDQNGLVQRWSEDATKK